MALIIHSNSVNKNVYKAQIAAEYVGVEIKLADNFEMGVSNKTPEFIKMNPIGKIPVLETPEGSVFESNAIARYVAYGSSLLGSSAIEYGQIEQWIDFSSNEIDSNLRGWLMPRFGYANYIKPVEESYIANAMRGFTALNTHLASHTFLVGDSVTLADIITTCNLVLGFKFLCPKSFTSEFPHVERYFWTMVNQPNFKKVIGEVKQAEAVPPLPSAKKPEQPKEVKPKVEPKKVEAPKPAVAEEEAVLPSDNKTKFSNMMFSRSAKQSIEILCRRASTPVHSRYGYSTRFYNNEKFIFEPQTPVRKYSSEASPSDHMNLIKKLRERTSAPIKEVKSALIDCNWDLEAAQKELRKRGIVLASKKSARTAAEGLLALAQNDTKAAVIELNCETDFVARNEIFQHLASSLAKLALMTENSEQVSGAFPLGIQSFEDLKINLDHPKLSGETTVQNAITEVAAIMGENVKLRRGFAMSMSKHGVMSTYLHTCPQPGLGRIAGILSLEVEDETVPLDVVQRVGAELAMHVVAAKPLVLTRELVSSDAVQNEREILKSQAESSGRPQAAIEKMVEGRLRKYFEEVVLMEQKFIVNDTINVKTLLSELSKEVGSPVTIGNFLRVEVGEGLQRADAPEALAQAA